MHCLQNSFGVLSVESSEGDTTDILIHFIKFPIKLLSF
ncbi:unnamed protein product, partial [Arabidopsis halleri]